MNIFKCKKCIMNCVLTVEIDGNYPLECSFDSCPRYADWVEVKEEACKVGVAKKKEEAESFSDLPKWAAVDKWIYNTKRPEYFKILSLNQLAWISDEIKNGDYIEARKRPFNEKEMRGLVGKVVTDVEGDATLITDFDNFTKKIRVLGEWFPSDELADSTWKLDGKPCYVLEHLENGEWVE